MESLFTFHDKFNIHKTLGMFCLVNYNLRLYYKIIYDQMFSNNIYIKFTFPIIHLSLSLSSFIFNVPSYRFNSKIIIWKELQLHNIIFTSRSSIIMLYSLYSNNIYGRLSIILLHHLLADYVSYNYRYNNKTTTRDIPYDNISNFTQYFIKKYYAINQLIATSSLLLSDKGLYENAFMIMYPIQLSTFLSTLVRKNLINNNMWHILYSISLALPLLIAQITPNINPNCSIKIKLTILFIISRLIFKINKYICISSLPILYIINKN
jgi:hypothetical protein